MTYQNIRYQRWLINLRATQQFFPTKEIPNYSKDSIGFHEISIGFHGISIGFPMGWWDDLPPPVPACVPWLSDPSEPSEGSGGGGGGGFTGGAGMDVTPAVGLEETFWKVWPMSASYSEKEADYGPWRWWWRLMMTWKFWFITVVPMRYRTCIQYYNVVSVFSSVCCLSCVCVCLSIYLNSYAANIYKKKNPGAFVHTFIHIAVLASSIPLATIGLELLEKAKIASCKEPKRTAQIQISQL